MPSVFRSIIAGLSLALGMFLKKGISDENTMNLFCATTLVASFSLTILATDIENLIPQEDAEINAFAEDIARVWVDTIQDELYERTQGVLRAMKSVLPAFSRLKACGDKAIDEAKGAPSLFDDVCKQERAMYNPKTWSAMWINDEAFEQIDNRQLLLRLSQRGNACCVDVKHDSPLLRFTDIVAIISGSGGVISHLIWPLVGLAAEVLPYHLSYGLMAASAAYALPRFGALIYGSVINDERLAWLNDPNLRLNKRIVAYAKVYVEKLDNEGERFAEILASIDEYARINSDVNIAMDNGAGAD